MAALDFVRKYSSTVQTELKSILLYKHDFKQASRLLCVLQDGMEFCRKQQIATISPKCVQSLNRRRDGDGRGRCQLSPTKGRNHSTAPHRGGGTDYCERMDGVTRHCHTVRRCRRRRSRGGVSCLEGLKWSGESRLARLSLSLSPSLSPSPPLSRKKQGKERGNGCGCDRGRKRGASKQAF